jgi:protein-disulfide isomerase
MSNVQPKQPSKRQVIREQRSRKAGQQRTLGIIVIVVVALAVFALLAVPQILKNSAPVGTIKEITPKNRAQVNGNSMGDPNAPVKIVEYSDYQCPYCKRHADETEQQLIDAYINTGKVLFTYRSMGNFVSDNVGNGSKESINAAMAAYCAGDQKKYWNYHDMLFANWDGEDQGSFSDQRLKAFAEKLGLNMTDFNSCLDSKKYETQTLQDRAEGLKAGVEGTPSFTVNGVLSIKGAFPFSEFQKQIDAALAAKK